MFTAPHNMHNYYYTCPKTQIIKKNVQKTEKVHKKLFCSFTIVLFSSSKCKKIIYLVCQSLFVSKSYKKSQKILAHHYDNDKLNCI